MPIIISNHDGDAIRAVEVNENVKKNFQSFNNKAWYKIVVGHNGKVSTSTILKEKNKQTISFSFVKTLKR